MVLGEMLESTPEIKFHTCHLSQLLVRIAMFGWFSYFILNVAFTLFWFDIHVFFHSLQLHTYICKHHGVSLLIHVLLAEDSWTTKGISHWCFSAVSSIPSFCLWRLPPSGTITWDIYDLSGLGASTIHLLLFFFFLKVCSHKSGCHCESSSCNF